MDIQLGRSKVVRRAYGIDEIALVPGGRTVDPEVTDTSWSLGGIDREIPIIASSCTWRFSSRSCRRQTYIASSVSYTHLTLPTNREV